MLSGRIGSARATRQATTTAASAAHVRAVPGTDYYGGVVVGAETIGTLSLSESTHNEVRGVLTLLESDDYSDYVDAFMDSGRRSAGHAWRYADIVTVLAAATRLVSPRTYLEIGVRRGRSLAVVAGAAPEASLIGVDMWVPEYAGVANPGPTFVREQLERVGFRGTLQLLSGDSHRLLPSLFAEQPGLTFDLITVDGDHTPAGARRDLLDVLPRLRIGGALVFDDIRHASHPKLARVWRDAVRDRRYSTWEFDDIGYGVAVAVRRW
jgi:predicted O-methyltransferase YrrM